MKKSVMLVLSIVIVCTLFMPVAANASAVLRVGSRGTEVAALQTKLKSLGYSPGAVDGIYGNGTKWAVISFQKNHYLQADGIAGPVTLQALDKAVYRKNVTNGILYTSKSLIGVPYVWGGTTPSGFDCSGFTKYVFGKQGITLPRMSGDQYRMGTPIAFDSLKPGDLVFFSFSNNGQVSHVGIYIGNGQFINASSSKGVIIQSFNSYWKNVYVGAKRIY